MSCNIRHYNGDKSLGEADMTLTAWSGTRRADGIGEPMIQFTMVGHFCSLGKAALEDLIQTIFKRLQRYEGYRSTDEEREDIIYDE